MPIIERQIEEYNDGLNITYFFHGDPNRPKYLIDEIENCYYRKIGWNFFDEAMYVKLPLDDFY